MVIYDIFYQYFKSIEMYDILKFEKKTKKRLPEIPICVSCNIWNSLKIPVNGEVTSLLSDKF